MTTKKKHILCVIGQLGNGGSEKQLYLFLKYLDKLTYSSTVFVTGSKGGIWAERIIENIGIKIIFTGNVSKIKKIRSYRKALKTVQPDIIFSWSFFTNILVYFSSKIPFVGSLRQQFSEENAPQAMKKFCLSPKMQKIIVNSTFIKNELINNAVPTNIVTVVYNIFEPQTILPKKLEKLRCKKRIDIADQYNIPSNAITIMGIGRNSPAKNFPFFINVFEKALHINPSLHAVIVGSGGDGIKDLIEEKKLKENITLTGEVPSAQKLLYAADLFFLSSQQEGLANVLVEAVNAGCATLATDVGGVRDIYKYVPEGMLDKILLTDFNIDTAAEKLANLAENKKLCGEVAEATSKFLQELQPDKIMEQYYRVLEDG